MNHLYNNNNVLISLFESFNNKVDFEQLKVALDLDHIDEILRQCLSINEMREIGSFFTGQKISTLAVKGLSKAITLQSVIIDPTCGAGNLLIECSKQLRIENNLSETLKLWGKVLCGFDIYESFITTTKTRLILEALNRGAKKDCSLDEAMQYFSQIKVKDAMSLKDVDLENVTHAIMNPPFSSWDSPEVNYWKKGKVNSAGIILDHYIRHLPTNCSISAILPDVLRSGTRYGKWRNYISENISGQCEVIGRFNNKTNVDVFLLNGMIQNNSKDSISWFTPLIEYTPISNYFDVRIGPVVAYRDPFEGETFPYIHPKNASAWHTIKYFDEYRKYSGAVITPPFVVIRRTSSPRDKYRALGTIIGGDKAIAVENHLIVIKPKSSTLRDCKKLLQVLKLPRTSEFLNNRMRCRHLTAGIVKEIPFD